MDVIEIFEASLLVDIWCRDVETGRHPVETLARVISERSPSLRSHLLEELQQRATTGRHSAQSLLEAVAIVQ